LAAYEEASAIVSELTAAHPDVVEYQRTYPCEHADVIFL
jgi:hypothetical protein